jgi:uncharacterized membrane protein YdbT with pleckstrin-like domain
MSYARQTLQPGERVLYEGRLHWMLYTGAIAALVVAVIAGGLLWWLATAPPSSAPILALLQEHAGEGALVLALILALAILAAVMSWIKAFIRRRATEIAITDRRVILKAGILRRRTVEMSRGKIETIKVEQGILGRLFGFGTIELAGTGGDVETLRDVSSPLEVRRLIEVS